MPSRLCGLTYARPRELNDDAWPDDHLSGGRYQTRTYDLFRVKEARYQLRQSPVSHHLAITPGVRDAQARLRDTPEGVGLEQGARVG